MGGNLTLKQENGERKTMHIKTSPGTITLVLCDVLYEPFVEKHNYNGDYR